MYDIKIKLSNKHTNQNNLKDNPELTDFLNELEDEISMYKKNLKSSWQMKENSVH